MIYRHWITHEGKLYNFIMFFIIDQGQQSIEEIQKYILEDKITLLCYFFVWHNLL